MKTFRLLAITGLMAFAGTASAQFVNSGSNATTTTPQTETGSRMIKDTRDYNRFEFGYLPSAMSFDYDDAPDDEKFKGFEVGYIHGFNLTKKLPLFLELGGQIQYRSYKDSWSGEIYYEGYYFDTDITYKEKLLSINIPVNLTYRLNINKDFAISPFFGFDFRINVIGKRPITVEVEGESADEDYNLFDEDEMGKDNTWKRFQAGWHIGVNLDWKALHVGVAYGTDMNEIAEKTKFKTTTVALGFNF